MTVEHVDDPATGKIFAVPREIIDYSPCGVPYARFALDWTADVFDDGIVTPAERALILTTLTGPGSPADMDLGPPFTGTYTTQGDFLAAGSGVAAEYSQPLAAPGRLEAALVPNELYLSCALAFINR